MSFPKQNNIVKYRPDMKFLVITMFLIFIGLMMILSAGASKCVILGKSPLGFAVKQLISVIAGIFLLRFFIGYNYKKLSKYAVPFAWAVVFFLALIDFTSLGVTVNGAKRWIALGPLQFQPSEMTKPALVLLLANAFGENIKIFDQDKILKYFLPIGAMVLLTAMQPNLSMVIISWYWRAVLCKCSLRLQFAGLELLP